MFSLNNNSPCSVIATEELGLGYVVITRGNIGVLIQTDFHKYFEPSGIKVDTKLRNFTANNEVKYSVLSNTHGGS